MDVRAFHLARERLVPGKATLGPVSLRRTVRLLGERSGSTAFGRDICLRRKEALSCVSPATFPALLRGKIGCLAEGAQNLR